MAGCYAKVAKLTERAMGGKMPMQQVFAERMELVQPTAAMLDELSRIYRAQLSEGAAEAIVALQQDGHEVFVVSGGCRQAIVPLAVQLNIAAKRVHAVEIYTDAQGAYCGFDRDSLLVKDGGKGTVCRKLCQERQLGVMVGDGHNDVGVTKCGISFIQFAGVVNRASLHSYAAAVIDGPSLTTLPVVVAQLQKKRQLRR